MAKLRVLKDGVEVQSVDLARLNKSAVSLGRAEGADIRLDDRAIGREHALFLVSSGGITIQKKSKFGKLAVNGAEVAESPVKPGDVINIADYMVKVEESGATQAVNTAATAAPAAAMDAASPPDLAAVPEGNTPPVTNPDAAPAVEVGTGTGAASATAMDAPMIDAAVPTEQPLMEAPSESSLKMDTPPAEAAPMEAAEAAPPADGGFAAEGGDRTAMISTAHVECKLVFKPGEANVEDFVIKKSEISIGRGTTCDVVINDKKSSRKHLIIKRVGMNFVAQDLGSANGTHVNNVKISEQELAGDDVLRIGDTEFSFKAVSQEYLQQEQNQEFIAPPAEEAPPEGDPNAEAQAMMMSLQGGDAGAVAAIDPATGLPMGAGAVAAGDPALGQVPGAAQGTGGTIPGMPGTSGPKKKETILGKYIAKFRALPPKKQAVVALIIVAFLWIFLDDGEDSKKKPKKPTQAIGASGADAEFAALPAEKKQFVLNTYQLGYDLYKKQDYENALFNMKKIEDVLPNGYKDSRDVIKYAQKSIDIIKANEEEKRRKEQEEKNRKELAELVASAEGAVAAGKDSEAKELFARILEKDPENPTILRLRQQMDEKEQEKKRQEEIAKDKEFKRQQLQSTLDEGKKLYAAGQYYDCIEKMGDALILFQGEQAMTDAAKELIAQAKQTIRDKSKPQLEAAKTAFDSGDYLNARDHYYKALKADPRSSEAHAGLSKIREILHERSRKIFVEAAVAEGISDYKTARERYKACLDQAMKEDSYYGMCYRKFKRFELLDRGVASSSAPAASGGGGAAAGDPSMPSLPKPVDVPAADEPPPSAEPEAKPDGGAAAPPAAAPPAAAPGSADPSKPEESHS